MFLLIPAPINKPQAIPQIIPRNPKRGLFGSGRIAPDGVDVACRIFM